MCKTLAVWSDFCAVAPSPELKERLLANRRRRGSDRHRSAPRWESHAARSAWGSTMA